jgi:hypothetical protein
VESQNEIMGPQACQRGVHDLRDHLTVTFTYREESNSQLSRLSRRPKAPVLLTPRHQLAAFVSYTAAFPYMASQTSILQHQPHDQSQTPTSQTENPIPQTSLQTFCNNALTISANSLHQNPGWSVAGRLLAVQYVVDEPRAD